MSALLDYFGRIHPVFLHFPIVLTGLASLIEFVRLWRDEPWLRRSLIWVLAMGAIGAVLTTSSGWLLAAHEHVRMDQRVTLEWHRWIGTLSAGLSTMALAACVRWGKETGKRAQWLICITVWGSALAVATAAHFGAMIVWGADWFS